MKIPGIFYPAPTAPTGKRTTKPAEAGAQAEHLLDGTEEPAKRAEDSLALSKEATERLREMKEAELSALETVQEQMESAQAQGDMMKKTMDANSKCMQIASRIMAGDKVPRQDEQYLSANNPEMYMQAISLRRQKESPKEYDSLMEDEKQQNLQGGTSVEGAPSVDSPPAADAPAAPAEPSTPAAPEAPAAPSTPAEG